MAKNKDKKPKDILIQNVMDDLKLETGHSIAVSPKKPSALGDAFLGFENIHNSGVLGNLPGIDADAVADGEAQGPEAPAAPADDTPEKTTILHATKDPAPLAKAAPQFPLHGQVPKAQAAKYDAPNFDPPKQVLMPKEIPFSPPLVPLAPVPGNPGDKFQMAETLKIAQLKIIDLEKEVENLRKENITLSSVGEMAKHQSEDFRLKIQSLERAHYDLKENGESELKIFKDGLLKKDTEIHRLRSKIDELENRLSNDLKKIRVRERELENRLELARMEKTALVRTKDENILDLKRRNDILETEIEKFQGTVLDLNEKIEANQEQFSRTVRALRIALTNLEVNENTSSITLAPIKKAE